MIEGLKSYPVMKDSGVLWNGAVPRHWKIGRVKHLFQYRKNLNTSGNERNILSLTLRGVVNNDPDNPEGLVPRDYATYQIFEKGDLVFKLIDLENLRTSRVGLVHERGIMSPAYLRLVQKNDGDICYFYYQFFDLYLRGIYNQIGAGVRSTLGPVDLLNLAILVPTRSEQADIVRFLDHADRLIRRHIASKRKLIALLNEQKQAIIHRAVTRGLDPNVRLKSSGVQWLDDVPGHWEEVRLGRLIQLTTGFPFKSEGFSHDNGDIRLLRGINIAPGKIRWSAVVRWPSSQRAEFFEYELREGDIVLGMDRPIISGGVRVAKIGTQDVPSLVLQRVARVRTKGDLDPEFTILLLGGKGFMDYLAPIFTGISVPHISPEQIASFRIVLPALSEQRGIVDLLRKSTAALVTSIGAATREIELLQEYRNRLIADVVTGKLDVRAAAAALPEVAEQRKTSGQTSEADEDHELVEEAGDEPFEEAAA